MVFTIKDDTNMFKFAMFAHGFLALMYYFNNNKLIKYSKHKIINNLVILSFIYVVAHSIISSAMGIRIIPEYRGSLKISILGTIGHTLLLIYFSFITLIIYKHKIIFNKDILLNLSCIIGQIGMIFIYWSEYIYKEKEKPILVKNIYLITFLILAIFYSLVAFKSIKKFNIMFFSSIFISILYSIFFNKEIQEKKLN